MKIALINGSPKVKNSSSGYAIQMLKSLLAAEHELIEYNFRLPQSSVDILAQIKECNVLVFSFPLYVDGIPSHLIHWLYRMEGFFQANPKREIIVYTLVNCGFYEGHQNVIALELMRNWCKKAGLKWGQGIGIGGGGMLPMLAGIPDGQGPKKNLSKALAALADNICAGATAVEDILISPNLPRFAYKLGAEMGWRQQIKANGLKTRDLSMKR